ncbi:hypothetical protein [Nostoc sp. CALU 1950]|uniref:hypothetical protein n=1 Tax=Nostoc sp. CALU 1950 TaxID=3104321 RepID=UPI003EBCA03E
MSTYLLSSYLRFFFTKFPKQDDTQAEEIDVDTALPSPQDFCDLKTAPLIASQEYLAQRRSVVVLMAR